MDFLHIFELISINSLEELKQKYKEAKKGNPRHLLFIFEKHRFSLCFVFLSNWKVDIDSLEEKLKTHENNQMSVILGLFCSLYATTDSRELSEKTEEFERPFDKSSFREKVFNEKAFNDSQNASEKLRKFLFFVNSKQKSLFYLNNAPTFYASSIFGGFLNDLIIKVVQGKGHLEFDLLVYNHQEYFDRTKDLGSTRVLSLFCRDSSK